MTDPKVLQECRNLGKDVFSDMGPDSEDGLFEFSKENAKGGNPACRTTKPWPTRATTPARPRSPMG